MTSRQFSSRFALCLLALAGAPGFPAAAQTTLQPGQSHTVTAAVVPPDTVTVTDTVVVHDTVTVIDTIPPVCACDSTLSDTTWDWTTGFETDQPLTSDSHAGGSIARSTEQVHGGTYSLKLMTPATLWKRGSGYKSLPYASRVHVVDLWFYLKSGANNDRAFEVAMEAWTGTEFVGGSFEWVRDDAYNVKGWQRWWNNQWNYLPGGQNVALTENAWHHFQGVVDFTTRKYVKMVIDGTVYDLAGLPLQVHPQVTSGTSYLVSILNWNQTPEVYTAYADDVRVGHLTSSE